MGGGSGYTVRVGESSPTLSSVEVSFGEQTAGQISVVELVRPPLATDYPRPYRNVVTLIDLSVPTRMTDQPGSTTIELKGSRLAELGLTADQLQVERYDPDTETWSTLEFETTVDEGDDTVSFRTDVPNFEGLLMVSIAPVTQSQEPAQTATPESAQTATPEPTPETPTVEEQASAGESPAPESSTPDDVTTTATEFPGFGVLVALLALFALALGLAYRRRD